MRNLPGEVDACGELPLVSRAEELLLKLRELWAEVTLLAVPVIHSLVSVKVATTSIGELVVVVLLRWSPSISDRALSGIAVRSRLGRLAIYGSVGGTTDGLGAAVGVGQGVRHCCGVERLGGCLLSGAPAGARITLWSPTGRHRGRLRLICPN